MQHVKLLAALALATPALAGGLEVRKVAGTGEAAPGTEEDVVFGALTTALNHDLLVPRIDETGSVAFTAILSGPGIDASNAEGVWMEHEGTLQLLARGGMPAPGTGPGVLFSGVPSLEVPFPPELGGGRTGFHAELTGPGVDITNDEGLWIGTPGDVQLVVRENDPVPGLAGLTFGAPFGLVDGAGHVLMQNDLRGPGVDSTNRSALLTDRSGTLEVFLREGDPAPSTEAGTVFGGNIPFRSLTPNANSDVAISAKLEGPSVGAFEDEALYVERDGALDLVLREGDPAPGAGAGVTFGGSSTELSLSTVSMNASGHVAFLVRLGGALPTTNAAYSDRGGVLAPLAIVGEPAPGVTFDFTILGAPIVNDASRVAFGAALPDDDGDIFTPPPFGVFSDLGGAVAPAVLPGDTTAEGEVVSDVRLVAFNAAGEMLLRLAVDAPAPRSGLWLRDADGALLRIAAVGESFEVDGTTREVLRVVGRGFNEAGEAAFRLDFTDGSSAHFVARPSPAEPGTPSCFGTDALCPCGNGSPDGGCRNSTGSGAVLAGAGSASVATDDLVLTATGFPPGESGLFFMGGALLPPVLVGDGLACTGGLFRFAPGVVDAAGNFSLDAAVASAPAGVIAPGDTRYFQAWARDVLCGPPPAPCASPCGNNSNLSNAYSVSFVP